MEQGDNLWNISKSHFGIGDLYYIIAEMNSLTVGASENIYEKQKLKIPLLWEVVLMQERLVKPGDTMWDRFIRHNSKSDWNIEKLKLPYGSSDPNIIYPMQVINP